MKKIRTIIVDDEKFARDALREALGNYPAVEVINQCKNGYEALKSIKKDRPDLVFLDVRMPELSGFDVLDLIEDQPVLVVFVTAYDEYAIKAFEKNAVDYILKPVNRKRLDISIQRIRDQIGNHRPQPLRDLLDTHHAQNAPIQRILVKIGTNAYVLFVRDIIYFQAADDYVRIHYQDRSFLKYETLSRLETLLDPDTFCRIHRSYIININYLAKMEPYGKDNHIAIMRNRDKIPISKKGFKKLQSLIH